MAKCRYCGVEVPEEFAACSGGYCEACEFVRPHEVEARLRISLDTLKRWLRLGKLSRIKAGRLVLIRRADVERLLRG